MRREGFTIFKKGSRGVSYVCAVKRRFRVPGQVFSESITALIDFIEKHPLIHVKDLPKELLGIDMAAAAGTTPPVEGQPAAVPALLPPPFPFTPFILTCGALDVDRWRFFGTLAAVRMIRFSVEALLALAYGQGLLSVMQSDAFRIVIVGFIVVALVGTTASGVLLWRSTRARTAA